jgi:predicted DsbA family dithiol-disulfide isomerase
MVGCAARCSCWSVPQTVEQLFRCYFEGGADDDISSDAVLVRIGDGLGLPGVRAHLACPAARARVLQQMDAVRGGGGVPAFSLQRAGRSAAPLQLSGAQPPEVFADAISSLLR